MTAVRAVVYCCAVLCCCCRSCCLCMLPPRSTKTLFTAKKCSRILPTNTITCAWSKKKKVSKCLFWEKSYITLVVTFKIKPYRVNAVWVKIWVKKTYITWFLNVEKLRTKPWVQQYATDVKNLLYLARLEFLCKIGCVPHYFQYKDLAFLFFSINLSLKFLIIRL